MSRWIDIDDDRNCYIDTHGEYEQWNIDQEVLEDAKSAEPFFKVVLEWLFAYHIQSIALHGRYLPNEVIAWLINDFTRNFIAEGGEQDE